MISGPFLPESIGSWQESTGKESKNFRPEYCFHVPVTFGDFLQDSVAGIINPGIQNKIAHANIFLTFILLVISFHVSSVIIL